MVTLTEPEAADLFDQQIAVSTFYRRMMTTHADPDVIAGALAIELVAQPDLAKTLHDCAGPGCMAVTTDPVRDEDAEKWMGKGNGPTYCSKDCLSNASEAYWTHRWTHG